MGCCSKTHKLTLADMWTYCVSTCSVSKESSWFNLLLVVPQQQQQQLRKWFQSCLVFLFKYSTKDRTSTHHTAKVSTTDWIQSQNGGLKSTGPHFGGITSSRFVFDTLVSSCCSMFVRSCSFCTVKTPNCYQVNGLWLNSGSRSRKNAQAVFDHWSSS